MGKYKTNQGYPRRKIRSLTLTHIPHLSPKFAPFLQTNIHRLMQNCIAPFLEISIPDL